MDRIDEVIDVDEWTAKLTRPLSPENERILRDRAAADAETARLTLEADARASEERAARTRRILGIPSRYLNVEPQAWKGGLLFGPVGCGKTHDAVARLYGAHLHAGAPRIAFVSISDYARLAVLIETSSADEEQVARWEWIHRAEHLVLDDVGVRRATEFFIDAVHALLDERWNEERETLATSDIDPERLGRILGDRIVSRLIGFGPVLRMTGRDRRMP